MDTEEEKQNVARLAKVMALMCIRNTGLENIHAGRSPISETGDYSDVFVHDAQGRKIPWTDVSHIDDEEMKALMKEIVNRLYTFLLHIDDPHFQALMERWATVSRKWDEPELEKSFLTALSDSDSR
ncbi:MAG: hypothetical protein COW30_11095 [Rhodospirillales bacterium CG15_BIG_FIL_POST_REV_8_21_14_020_66_15]|nr:MAG: hypothetical protein COW30_11095 [Rhodospirillales bacterium CG15_BIG_FIL_POST_REV_8_21_14_020_66_15]